MRPDIQIENELYKHPKASSAKWPSTFFHLLNKLCMNHSYKSNYWAVVVAQLVERSLPIPEVRGSNPVIGKILFIY